MFTLPPHSILVDEDKKGLVLNLREPCSDRLLRIPPGTERGDKVKDTCLSA